MRGAGGDSEGDAQSDGDVDSESDVEERTDAVNPLSSGHELRSAPQQELAHVLRPPVDDNASVSSRHSNVIGNEADQEEEVPMDVQQDHRSDISRPVFGDLTMANQPSPGTHPAPSRN